MSESTAGVFINWDDYYFFSHERYVELRYRQWLLSEKVLASEANFMWWRSGFGDNDRRAVARAAAQLQSSEFEVFRLAYEYWHGQPTGEGGLDVFFRRYLQLGEVPLWVRDFTRKLQQSSELVAQLATSNHRLPVTATHRQSRSPLLGLLSMVVMFAVVWLLIDLAIDTQQQLQLVCMLPPCY